MNYRIVGKENRIFGPYTIAQLQNFANEGKLRPNMCLIDDSSNKYYAKDIVTFAVNQDTVDLSYLSDSTPLNHNVDSQLNNSDYVDLTYLSNDFTQNNYNDQNNNVDLTNNNDFDNRYNMIANDGKRYGPYSIEELNRFVTENRVAPNTILINNNGQSYQAREILTFSNNSSYSYNINDSGMGASSVLPYQLRGLNWGAFLLPLFWGLSHNTLIALACLIPSVGWVVSFILLFKGNEWAWQNRRWTSIENFLEVQRIWYKWGVGVIIASLVLGGFPLLFVGCCGCF